MGEDVRYEPLPLVGDLEKEGFDGRIPHVVGGVAKSALCIATDRDQPIQHPAFIVFGHDLLPVSELVRVQEPDQGRRARFSKLSKDLHPTVRTARVLRRPRAGFLPLPANNSPPVGLTCIETPILPSGSRE